MIIYSVTINIDDDVQQDWLRWMKEVHIPDVMSTGLFVENRLLKLLNVDDQGTTYSIQYMLRSMEDYETYQKDHAPRLQALHTQRYRDKFVAFRTLLEVV
jgi:hypothetical protein